MLGPMTRARLKPPELSAIASPRSSFTTSSTMNDWRVGTSKALIVPLAIDNSSKPVMLR